MPEPKTSFKRITPLSTDLAAHGRTRTLALQKLLAEVGTLKARYTLATVKLALSKYRERDPRRRARSLGVADSIAATFIGSAVLLAIASVAAGRLKSTVPVVITASLSVPPEVSGKE